MRKTLPNQGRWLASIGLAAILTAPAALAQEPAGVIRGRTTDPQSSPLSGVVVTAQSTSLPARVTTRTSSSGEFLFVLLPPGDYVVTFSREDLVETKRTMRLSARENAAVDVALAPKPSTRNSDPIAVSNEGRATLIRSPLSGVTFRPEDVAELPIAGTVSSVLTIAPGLVPAHPQAARVTWNGAPSRLTFPDGQLGINPTRDALADLTIVGAGLPASVGGLEAGFIAIAGRTGMNVTGATVQLTGGSVSARSDSLWQAAQRQRGVGGVDATIGGPIWPGHTWYFLATDSTKDSTPEQALDSASFDSRAEHTSVSGNLMHAFGNTQRIQVQASRTGRDLRRATPALDWRLADEAAASGSDNVHTLWSAAYLGRFGAAGPGIEFRVTDERLSTTLLALPSSSFVDRTPIVDLTQRIVSGAPRGCAGCGEGEWRDQTARLALTAHATRGPGSHELMFGGEMTSSRSLPAPERGNRFELLASRMTALGTEAAPVLVPNGSSGLVWYPADAADVRTTTQAAFIGDRWRSTRGLTVEMGVRLERRDLTGPGDVTLVQDRAISPRIAVAWEPTRVDSVRVTAGYARYTAPVESRLDLSLAGTRPVRLFAYDGPPINVSGPVVDARTALATVEAWFVNGGGFARTPAAAVAFDAITPGSRIDAPQTNEWFAGLGRQFGSAELRAEVIRRDTGSLRIRRAVAGSTITSETGAAIDHVTLENTNDLGFKSTELVLQGHYRLGLQAVLGAAYTYTRASGSTNAITSEPLQLVTFGYPEFLAFPASRADTGAPFEPRHRFQGWATAQILNKPSGTLSVDLLLRVDSGATLGAVGWIDSRPFLVNPGYAQPPVAVPFAFAANEFETPSLTRLDMALRYSRPLGPTVRGQWFVRLDVLNLFDRTVDLDATRQATVVTALQDPQRFSPFNPFLVAPVRGVHWDISPAFPGAPTVRTLPRSVRWLVGIRF